MVLLDTKNNNEKKEDSQELRELIIQDLSINEFYPLDQIYKSGPIFKRNDLKKSIQDFFTDHILNSVINNPRSRTGRFSTNTSSILSDIKNILEINNDPIDKSVLELLLTENQKEEDFDEATKRFYYYSDNISKKFKQTLTNQAKNEFLLIIIKCKHQEYGDIVAILKMEKVFGVQYADSSLQEQLDMLPDKKSGLQKAAVIYKNKLIEFPNLQSFKDDNDTYHTKIVDKQDTTISKSFIEAFLGNSIVHRNAENTSAAFNQIKLYFQDYLLDDYKKSDIDTFLKKNNPFGATTTVESLVEQVIKDSNIINHEKIDEASLGITTIASDIFKKMQQQNSSASAEFNIDFKKIPKYIFSDTKSEGKLIKLIVALESIELQQVILNADISNLDSITNWENKTFIAIDENLINLKLDN